MMLAAAIGSFVRGFLAVMLPTAALVAAIILLAIATSLLGRKSGPRAAAGRGAACAIPPDPRTPPLAISGPWRGISVA